MSIPNWMKRSFVILLSILTLGLVSPDDFHWQDEASANKPGKKSLQEERDYSVATATFPTIKETSEREKLLEDLYEKAEESSYSKFGERIKPRIEEEFNTIILPKMEETISNYIENCSDEDLVYIGISEKPSKGMGEKIFHIYNKQSGKDIIRFHVRRENPPQQGYWFNIHYHTSQDNYETHHSLGSIYWDKNTPPNWGAEQREYMLN